MVSENNIASAWRSDETSWWSFLFYGADGRAYEAMYSIVTGWHVYWLTDAPDAEQEN